MNKINLVIAGAVLAVVIAGGMAVYAADNKPKMIDSAVDKGIITQEQADNLQNYGKEFRKENQKANMEARINQAVSDGTITQDEAKQIRDWQNAKPAAMDKLAPMKGKGMGM
jgi:polyhydroxyalkanoate synthesis regulator phasin